MTESAVGRIDRAWRPMAEASADTFWASVKSATSVRSDSMTFLRATRPFLPK